MSSQRRPVPQVAVIGAGYWGRNLVRNFAELGALRTVCDPDSAAMASMQELYGVPPATLDSLLDDEDVDAVAIAAPAKQHAELALAALRAGKHVFVEKPLALTIPDAEAVVAAAAEAKRVLMVGHLLQYHSAFLRLHELVADGTLGRLDYIYSNRLNLGKFRREEDILWSFAPHDISMILALVGTEPDEVVAVGSHHLHPSIADVTTTHLQFAGGQRAHVFVSWLHPFKEQKLVVVGTEGMAVFDDGEPWESKLRLFRHRVSWMDGAPQPVKADAQAIEVEPTEPLRAECAHFLECVATGATPRTDGEEGVRVLRVLRAASASMTSAAPRIPSNANVHESAYVDEPSTIGDGTRIWHFSHVLPGSTIGRNCTIGQNVVIGPDVTIGDDCKIQNNVSLYKGVTLEDGVFCGPSCVFTNVLNPRAELERKDEFRSTIVRRGATIGANATIVCGNEIGAYSMVAAGAVVTRDVPPHALVAGVPARRVGWVSHDGEVLDEQLVCPRTGRRYQLAADEVLEEVRG